jgi:hypothetical protein
LSNGGRWRRNLEFGNPAATTDRMGKIVAAVVTA